MEPYRSAKKIAQSFPNLRNNLAATLIYVNSDSGDVARLPNEATSGKPCDQRKPAKERLRQREPVLDEITADFAAFARARRA